MCRGGTAKGPDLGQNRSLFMFSVEDFSGHNGIPSTKSQCFTAGAIILFLVSVEMSLRQFFFSIKVCRRSVNPILWTKMRRNVFFLARMQCVARFDSIRFSSIRFCFFFRFSLIVLGLPPNLGRRHRAKGFGSSRRRWCRQLFRSSLPRMDGTTRGSRPYWCHYRREKECDAGCLWRTNVHLPTSSAAHRSLFRCLSNQEHIRHNCLERRHHIYSSSRSYAIHYREFSFVCGGWHWQLFFVLSCWELTKRFFCLFSLKFD